MTMMLRKAICWSPLKMPLMILMFLGLWMSSVQAELRIDVSRGRVEPLPIAIVNFAGETAESGKYGRELAQVISDNLRRSGLFDPVNPRAFIQRQLPVELLPRFGDWRVINAQALVNGSVDILADGRLRVEFRLWDVFAEVQLPTSCPMRWSASSTANRSLGAHIDASTASASLRAAGSPHAHWCGSCSYLRANTAVMPASRSVSSLLPYFAQLGQLALCW